MKWISCSLYLKVIIPALWWIEKHWKYKNNLDKSKIEKIKREK